MVTRAHGIIEAGRPTSDRHAAIAADLEPVARSYRDGMQIDDAFRRADLVVCAKLAGTPLNTLLSSRTAVELEVLQGMQACDRITIRQCCDGHELDERDLNIRLYPANLYLIALQKCGDGHYSIVNGKRGILRYNGNGLTTLSGHHDPAIADIWASADDVNQ